MYGKLAIGNEPVPQRACQTPGRLPMKSRHISILSLLLLAVPLSGYAADQLIPAGSLIECTISEPGLSSKTVAVGDPVLCQVSHFTMYGHSVFPYGTFLVGRFEKYKDPGHFVGKGWMDLEFNAMVLPPDEEISMQAKVVHVPGYPVDKQGRILGKGHPVRDTVEWSIPVLWPIDLLNLPRRGPRPALKDETRLTLKVMEDMEVPLRHVERDNDGFAHRTPMSYRPPMNEGPAMNRPLSYDSVQPATPHRSPATTPVTLLFMRNGRSLTATRYWFADGSVVVYVDEQGRSFFFPIEMLDFSKTVKVNRNRGVNFVVRSSN